MKRWIKTLAFAAVGAAAAGLGLLGEPEPQGAYGPPERDSRARGGKKRWKRIAALFAVFLVLMGIGGFLVAASGIIPIKASSGHWPITAWFLNFSMKRSISTHSLGTKAPPLDDPALVLRGAGHYETGCLPCHGGPGLRQPRVARAMTPHPPYLPPKIPEWDPEELFYLVKHGVKFTGMPAWPAQERDDEVWAMVAFLLRFPEMDAAEYRRLVRGGGPAMDDEDAPLRGLLGTEGVPLAVNRSCGRCHGGDGLGRGLGAFPKLAGQRPAYLYNALQAFARGERHSGIMEPVAAGLSTEEMRSLALYYSRLPGLGAAEGEDRLLTGRSIAHQGIPAQRVPACAACHGPGPGQRNPAYPELAGQYARYLVLQLELFKEEHRGGSPYAHLMHEVAPRLTPEQMRDVALYYQSLGSGPAP